MCIRDRYPKQAERGRHWANRLPSTKLLTRGRWGRSIYTLHAQGTPGSVIWIGSMAIIHQPTCDRYHLQSNFQRELATRQVKILITFESKETVHMEAAGTCSNKDKGTGQPPCWQGGCSHSFGGASRRAGPLKSCNLVTLLEGLSTSAQHHRILHRLQSLHVQLASFIVYEPSKSQVKSLTHPPTSWTATLWRASQWLKLVSTCCHCQCKQLRLVASPIHPYLLPYVTPAGGMKVVQREPELPLASPEPESSSMQMGPSGLSWLWNWVWMAIDVTFHSVVLVKGM